MALPYVSERLLEEEAFKLSSVALTIHALTRE
jgi:hypothetical protein